MPLDPDWEGGAWYGPSSGTFWTLNPREYADPRKHGPEYLARARRPTASDGASGAGGDEGRWRLDDADGPTTQGDAGEWTTGPWGVDPGGADAHAGGTADEPDAAAGASPFPDLESLARRITPRALLALARRPDRRWRLILALVGWPPIGYVAGSLLATITGCATFAASCPEPLPLLLLLAQPGIVAALYLVVPGAAVAAFATLVGLAVALPVATVLAVGTLPESRVGAPVLGAVVAVAWVAAVATGLVTVRRDTHEATGRSAPAP